MKIQVIHKGVEVTVALRDESLNYDTVVEEALAAFDVTNYKSISVDDNESTPFRSMAQLREGVRLIIIDGSSGWSSSDSDLIKLTQVHPDLKHTMYFV